MIGQRIRKLRIAHGMTQQELADKVGDRAHTSISLIEGGKRTHLSMATLEKFANAFDISVLELMGAERVEKLPQSEMEIIGDK